MQGSKRKKPAQALKRSDPVKRSPKPLDDVEVLDRLVTELVEARRRRPGSHELIFITDLSQVPADPYPGDTRIKREMAKIGRRLAARLDFEELHDTIERVAGDPNDMYWGQRFSPLASALNGAITRDGVTWIT